MGKTIKPMVFSDRFQNVDHDQRLVIRRQIDTRRELRPCAVDGHRDGNLFYIHTETAFDMLVELQSKLNVANAILEKHRQSIIALAEALAKEKT
jgi:hypothetical protein